MSLNGMGDPMFSGDFSRLRKPTDGDNAAPLLRGAANAIDDDSAAWMSLDRAEIRAPLTKRENRMLGQVVEQNRPALAMLAAARAKKSVHWDESFSWPMCDTWVTTDRKQRILSQSV